MKLKLTALTAALLILAFPLADAATNVALGGAVTTSGTGFGISDGWGVGVLAGNSSLTDGVFLPVSQQWNIGTVYWQGGVPDTGDVITVTLAQASTVDSLHLEGDNNDAYSVSYRDLGGSWHALAVIDPNTNSSWGLGDGYASFSPVSATAFQITATGGDGSFAVSEFQADGAAIPAVPEPTNLVLLAAGLAVVGLVARRRRQR